VDGRNVFALTDSGREAVPERTEGKQPWEEGDEDTPHHKLRAEAFRTRAALVQIGRAGEEEQVKEAVEILTDTRKRLYSILAEAD
jgi:hypothetical protein